MAHLVDALSELLGRDPFARHVNCRRKRKFPCEINVGIFLVPKQILHNEPTTPRIDSEPDTLIKPAKD